MRLQSGNCLEFLSPESKILLQRIYCFFSGEGADESKCAIHRTVTKQTVISLSGNLVSSASDITDECDVRMEGGGGGEGVA